MSNNCCRLFQSYEYDGACNLILFDEQGNPNAISLFAATVQQFPGGFKITSLNDEILVATGSGVSYAEVSAQIASCNSGGASASNALDELALLELTDSGLEFTGGFIDRTTGTAGASDVGSNRQYTSADAAADRWILFGLSETARDNNDVIYWTDPDTANLPGYDSTKGLFGGTQLPTGVDNLFNYTSTALSADVTTGSPQYTGAPGSLDFSTCKTGDKLECRFDFNVVPQIANTTLEVALIWATRDSNDNVTFTFPLAAQPVFFGEGTVGRTFLNRPVMTAYFASNEDINAVALPAIKADNQIQIQPLTLLASIQR